MYIIEDVSMNLIYKGESLDYLFHDDLMIGEVYLDGKLIFQTLDSVTEEHVSDIFCNKFKVLETI
jgi:hypothetical protein